MVREPLIELFSVSFLQQGFWNWIVRKGRVSLRFPLIEILQSPFRGVFSVLGLFKGRKLLDVRSAYLLEALPLSNWGAGLVLPFASSGHSNARKSRSAQLLREWVAIVFAFKALI